MKKSILSLLMIFITTVGYAEILQVQTMDELESSFIDADEKTLAIFDVDMVLVQPEDPAFQMQNIKRFGSSAKRIMSEIPKDKQMIFLSLMTLSSKTILIDNQMPKFFQQLSQRSIPTIALTANLTGQFCEIDNMEKWRAETLRSLGIDFTKTSPCKTSFVFTELASFRQNFCSYTDGMLFVNGKDISKGAALIAFLEKAQLHPSQIIFIDDREENLKSVEAAAQKLKIAYKGIHYLGAAKYPAKAITEEQFESQWNKLANAARALK